MGDRQESGLEYLSEATTTIADCCEAFARFVKDLDINKKKFVHYANASRCYKWSGEFFGSNTPSIRSLTLNCAPQIARNSGKGASLDTAAPESGADAASASEKSVGPFLAAARRHSGGLVERLSQRQR